jgi:hypothetical protein
MTNLPTRIQLNRDDARMRVLADWRDKYELDREEAYELACLPRRVEWLKRQLGCAQENTVEQVQVSA